MALNYGTYSYKMKESRFKKLDKNIVDIKN